MDHRRLIAFAGLLVMVGGCAHHNFDRPPTSAQIEEINRAVASGDQPAVITFIPRLIPAPEVAGQPPPPGQAVAGAYPNEARRIVSADATKLTVLDKQGATRSVDLALVDSAVTVNRRRAMGADGALGALAGLGVSGVIALSLLALNAAPDQPYPPSAPTSTGTALGVVVVGTLVGGILGLIIGDRNPEQVFTFNGGSR